MQAFCQAMENSERVLKHKSGNVPLVVRLKLAPGTKIVCLKFERIIFPINVKMLINMLILLLN